jgi:hypothetical protein
MPPVAVNRFIQAANAAGADACLGLSADGKGVIAKGTSLTGRAVAWLKGIFGVGKEANRKDITDFCASVRFDYGQRAGDAVEQQLRARLEEGKPLRARQVTVGAAVASAMRVDALVAQLADLGDGTAARGMIQELVDQGALSREGAARLLSPRSPEGVELVNDIRQAVSEAATENPGQPLGLAPAVVATKRVVDDAARRIANAENEELAGELADLGSGMPARRMIEAMFERGDLSRTGATALVSAGTSEHVENAVLAAAADGAKKGTPRLGRDEALIATEHAVAWKAADVMLRPESDSGLTTRLLDIAQGTLEDVGIELPVNRELLGKMTNNDRGLATQVLATKLAGSDAAVPEAELRPVAAYLRQPMAAEIVETLKANGAAAHDMLAELRLPANLEADKDGRDPLGTRLLTTIADTQHEVAHASTGPAQHTFDAALLRACRERFNAEPAAAPKIRKLVKSAGLVNANYFRKLPPAQQREVLDLCADLDAKSVELAPHDPSAADVRTRAAMALADLVTLKIREIRDQHHCSEAEAIDRLNEADPGLIERMDRVLSAGGENPAPRAWLDTRKQLATMRGGVKTMAESNEFSGTDMQRLISERLRGMAENVFDSAVTTLGKPPMPFTVLGLGSTARGEASPYSDLEFGILLQRKPSEAEQGYFLELSERVRDQMAAVGEQESYYKRDGFHFDAKLSPLTTSEGTKRPFLGTADDLAANLVDETNEWQRTSLINAEWLYGSDVRRNDTGGFTEPGESWRALQDFRDTLLHRLDRDNRSGETAGEKLASWTLDQARDMGSGGLQRRDEGVIDVKELARLPMLLVQGLAVQHGLVLDPATDIAANNIDQRLTLLVEKGVISRKDADAIFDLQDGLSKLRVRSHAEKGKQVDHVALTEQAGRDNDVSYDPHLKALVEDAEALLDRVGTYKSSLDKQVAANRELRLNPPKPTFSERQTGDFSRLAVKAFQNSLNEDLRHTSPPGADFNALFLKDIRRGIDFQFEGHTEPWPDIPQDGTEPLPASEERVNQLVEERKQPFHDFFRDDLVGKQAVTQLTTQTVGNTLLNDILDHSPHGPFQGAILNYNNIPGPERRDRFEISRTSDQGYRVAFVTGKDRAGMLSEPNGSETWLDGTKSRLDLKGTFEISRASIDQGRPRAKVTSLSYDYEFHPA